MPHNSEQKRRAGQKGRKHGAYAIEERGEAALDAAGIQTLREIEASLETPEGIVTALRKRVSMGLMIVSVIEKYAKDQVNSGKTPDQIPILKAWPAFQNSTIRALRQLMETFPKAERNNYQEALERINIAIDEQIQSAKESPSDAVDAQIQDDLLSPETQEDSAA